jgi:glycolate oxidase FAD binding subunit
VSSVCSGVHTARVRTTDTAATKRFISTWRKAVHEMGGAVTLRQRALDVDRDLDCWGPSPQAVSVLRQIKSQFDPHDRCNPGRFAPWF